MKVTLICTVLNEEGSIASLLDSVLAQSRQPDQVVIVDGGSRDGTVGILKSYQDRLPWQVLVSPDCNISQGRNRAIEAASGDVIASTDAGVRLDPGWLEALLSPFERRPQPDVSCGFFLADPRTAFETAMGATVLPEVGEIDPAVFLPSSRSVAFTKEAWQEVGGYPEWLDYCEDLVFDMDLKKAGCTFAWAPGALAHFRPRPTLTSFFRQYYHYARGDGKANLWRKRHAIRYSAYLVALAALIAGFWQTWAWLLLVGGAAAYTYHPYRRLSRSTSKLKGTERIAAALWVPVIRVTGDVAKMAGYPVGVAWRRKNGVTPRASR